MLTELGDTSKLVTDLTQSQHMNLHIRQRIAGAAAGTLRKYLRHETFWSEWALECGIDLGQLASQTWPIPCMGARQDRSRVKTSSVSGVIQSLKFVRRKAQVDSLITVLNSSLVTGTPWVRHSRDRDEQHCHCPESSARTMEAMDLQSISTRT